MSSEETPDAIEPIETPERKMGWFRRSINPFRIATLRGLGVVLPPLLTIIFFFWAWNTIDRAVVKPARSVATRALVWSMDKTLTAEEVAQSETDKAGRRSDDRQTYFDAENVAYERIGKKWIPGSIINYIDSNPPGVPALTADAVYRHYVNHRFLKNRLLIPFVLALFLAFLYLTGKLIAAGIGRIIWRSLESLINRVPIIRNVYSSVKQVTDFAFSDSEKIQFNRVVALEYPRKGIWSMGFVTGESMADIRDAAGEPMLSVLMPTSPMPATGFTVSVPKSETIDLDLTIDQAIQYCVSCGVVVPPHQLPRPVVDGRARLVSGQVETNNAESENPNMMRSADSGDE